MEQKWERHVDDRYENYDCRWLKTLFWSSFSRRIDTLLMVIQDGLAAF